ncbi:DUF3422 domain-containing protein [Qipengyuania soli]|nr:DUF3422 domain-containing protein [Qipengyuania soli]
MREHELRQQINTEMHLRRWPPLNAPAYLLQNLRIVAPEERDAENELVGRWLDSSAPLDPTCRHVSGSLPGGTPFTWERHTEGSTITVFHDGAPEKLALDDTLRKLDSLPGKVLRATEIILVASERDAHSILPGLKFNDGELVSSQIGGAMRFWSDFRLHERRYGRVLVATCGAEAGTISRIVQQLQELGNYRNLALLALPTVRRQWAELDGAEAELGRIAERVSDPATNDDDLLEGVSELSLNIANLTNEVGYRLDATRAYAELVSERLEDLAPEPIGNHQSLTSFTRRRLMPAVRTCAAHRDRLLILSQRAANLTALLRARVETRIENQNARLLGSMERTSQRQMRLQQLVEGLSIFALAYYGVGLLGYVLDAMDEHQGLPTHAMIKAWAVPVFMATIWLGIHAVKRRILADDG